VSAEAAMKHTYFDSLGPAVKMLPDSKLLWYDMIRYIYVCSKAGEITSLI